MSKPEDLKDLYIEELQDLWSANDQMSRTVKKIIPSVADQALKTMLSESQQGIATHTELLKTLITGQGEKASKEHCKGMEGITQEAVKHAVEEAPDKGPLLDAVIITQYQRMSHYGVAGFGTAAAYADTLGLKDDAQKLKAAVKEIYATDKYLSKLSETSVNIHAKAA